MHCRAVRATPSALPAVLVFYMYSDASASKTHTREVSLDVKD